MIKVKHRVESFGANRAVEDISFGVGRGKCSDFWVPTASANRPLCA